MAARARPLQSGLRAHLAVQVIAIKPWPSHRASSFWPLLRRPQSLLPPLRSQFRAQPSPAASFFGNFFFSFAQKFSNLIARSFRFAIQRQQFLGSSSRCQLAIEQRGKLHPFRQLSKRFFVEEGFTFRFIHARKPAHVCIVPEPARMQRIFVFCKIQQHTHARRCTPRIFAVETRIRKDLSESRAQHQLVEHLRSQRAQH